MRLYLGRRANSTYMLTRLRPVVRRVRGTRDRDLYMVPGEPVGLLHLCARGAAAIYPPARAMASLECCRVDVVFTTASRHDTAQRLKEARNGHNSIKGHDQFGDQGQEPDE